MRPKTLAAVLCALSVAVTGRYLLAQAATDPSFDELPKPFFQKNCMPCHNSDVGTAGIRVDQLDGKLEDRQIPVWEAVRNRVKNGTMPPKGLPQPTPADRDRLVAWIDKALETARLRPAPKNGLVRRLTISQYRNTLRELLLLDDDLTTGLPPDAVSKDGFLNNKDTLQLSPLLTESYFTIAEAALNRVIVDPAKKPSIQNFRVDFGAGINPAPLPEKLILGAGSLLLDNPDFMVTQLVPVKPFPFDPFFMRTKYRFIEGYRGNDTVRGWRDFDSIYHAVFADIRGSGGYPKGHPYGVVKDGLVLRPAIPTDEIFGSEGTYGPKANFKISVRELPDDGRFRVTVTAAKYNDGLLLDPGALPQHGEGVVPQDGVVNLPHAGIYQVDVFGPEAKASAPDPSRLKEGLTGVWPTATGSLTIPRADLPMDDPRHVGEGDFSAAFWVKPHQQRHENLISLGSSERTLGWWLDVENRGVLRFQTAGSNMQAGDPNGTLSSRPGVLKPNAWQHVAIVSRRGRNDTRIYVNGYLVAKGAIGSAEFDDPKSDLHFGGGEISDARLYRRPLSEAEILALVGMRDEKPARSPEQKQDLTLTIAGRQFDATLQQPAFVVARFEAGPTPVRVKYTGIRDIERVVFTPLAATDDLAKRFAAFEKQLPRVGVHLGLRRDCGSTFAPVGPPQTVTGDKFAKYVFEGSLRNFPSPEVEKDNVNYLAGVREIGVRSEYTDGRDMPRLLIRSIEFEGPLYDSWPPATHRNIFTSTDPRKVLHDFATRAYRRPVTPAEEAILDSVYQKAGMKDALLAVLTSPQFLFLIENSSSPGPEPLDNYELASKLSYWLWNGPPDKRLLQEAGSGSLRTQLNAEVTRMIADSKFERFTKEFTSQWLQLDKFAVLEPDRKRYPKLTRDTRTQLRQEPIEFVQYLIRNNLPVRNLVQSDFIMANEVVASYYGLGDKVETGFNFVALPHGRAELGGLLTQAALMAGLSDGRESNPVKRGAWLARKIIAEPPADPPPNVPALKESSEGLTLRQRLEQHRNQNGCRQCHTKIDPWGVALEEFDAGGRLKTQPVDAKSTLPDKTEVSGANDLKRYLGQDRIDQIAFSFLKHLATYATGRTLTYNELVYLKQDQLKLKPAGYRMQDMIRYVAGNKIFLEK